MSIRIYTEKDGTASSFWPTNDTKWVHLVFVVPSGTSPDWKVYVDGDDVSDESNVTEDSPTRGWRTWPTNQTNLNSHSHWFYIFGIAATSAKSQPGSIGLVRIYNGKALSSSEVEQNYNAEKSNFGHT